MDELGIANHPSRIGGMSLNITVKPFDNFLGAASGLGLMVANGTNKEIKFTLEGQVLTASARELIPIASLPQTDFEFLKTVAEGVRANMEGTHSSDLASASIRVQVARIERVDAGRFLCTPIFTAPKK